MNNQANKMRNKQLAPSRLKVKKDTSGEIEPQDYRTRDEFKDACQTVLDFLLRTDSRTIGAVSPISLNGHKIEPMKTDSKAFSKMRIK